MATARPRPDLPLVEVEVASGAGHHWIREVIERWNVRVRSEVCRPMGANGTKLLQAVELVGSPGDLGAAERYLRHSTEFESLTILPTSPTRRFVRAVTVLPPFCRNVFRLGAICKTCRFASAGTPERTDRWTVVVPRTPASLKSVARADGRGPNRVLRIRRFAPARTLTPRQAVALETAYRLGFYAFPRRSNLQEISRILGVSRSTTGELLRRAEHKMLSREVDPS